MKHLRLSWSAGLLLLIGFLASAGSAKAQVTLCLGDAVPNGWGITSYGVDFRCGNPTPQVPKTSKVIARFDNLFDGDTFDSCTPLIVNAPPDFVIVSRAYSYSCDPNAIQHPEWNNWMRIQRYRGHPRPTIVTGALSSITNGSALGYASDPGVPNGAVTVHIYIDNVLAAAVLANLPHTTGPHAFAYAIPDQFRDGANHALSAYGIDLNGDAPNQLLAGSPKTFNLPRPNPAPTVISLLPASVRARVPLPSFSILGTNFMSTSIVRWNGANRPTVFISPTELKVTLTAADLPAPGTGSVSVFNPLPGGGTSSALSLLIRPREVAGDFDGDGKANVSTFRPSTNFWYVQRPAGGSDFYGFPFGAAGDQPLAGDFDGDGKADVAVFRPSDRYWYWLDGAGTLHTFQFGLASDLKVPADFDGDGKTDIAIFRPGENLWVIAQSSDGKIVYRTWGTAGDIPVPADYDGDGRADLAVFRPSDGTWYIQTSTNNALSAIQFGLAGDKPVPADYDGDGKADPAVFRPSDAIWYTLQSSVGFRAEQWGLASDQLAPGDYDGDGKADLGVFRTSNNTWYARLSGGGTLTQYFGLSGDVNVLSLYQPVPSRAAGK